jgi:transporter family-2 protein
MSTFYILLAFLAGCGLPLQAAANARLSKALASPFSAACLQLALGGALLFVLAIASGEIRAVGKLAQAEWWRLCAGLASAAYVVAGIVLFPRLGAVATVGLFIAGQALASLLLDGFGLLGIARRVPGPLAWLGAACVAAGIVLIVRGQRRVAETGRLRMKAAWVALGAVCGGLLPVQGALNAGLARAVGAPLAVSLTSFMVAAAGMAAILAAVVALGIAARPRLAGLCGMPWWGWLGGVVGACYVTTVFTAMPVIGAAATVGFTIAGQQLVSMLIDRFGWLGLPKSAVSPVRLAGAMVLLAGVVSIKLF